MSANTSKGILVDIDDSLKSIDTKTIDSSTIISSIDTQIEGLTEEITGGMKSINTDHGLIHQGYGYCVSLYLASLAPNAFKRYRFKGPTTLYAHIKAIQLSLIGSTVSAKLIKNPVITNAGVEITDAINNLNDNSTSVAQSKFYDSAVTYTGGTVWCRVIVNGSTTAQSSSGGSFIQNDNLEYISKKNDTDYIIELQNLDNSDTALHLNLSMFYYEEPNGLAEGY
jgi:hypothetical protein